MPDSLEIWPGPSRPVPFQTAVALRIILVLLACFQHPRSVPVEGDIGVTASRPSNRSNAATVPLATDLPDVEAEPVLDIACTVEAARHQRLDPGLGGGTAERGQERVPLRLDLVIRRQARDI